MPNPWVPPAGFRRTLNLSSGKAEVRVSYCIDTVDAKVRVFGHVYRGVKGDSAPLTVKYPVKTCSIRIKMANGDVVKVRSCCKPPDVFSERRGLELAAKRLVRSVPLSRDDKRVVMEALCPAYFSKREAKPMRMAAMSRKIESK